MDIGIKLRQLRQEHGYSQEYIASQLEISQAQYCRIECGKSTLSTDKFLQLATIYSISPNQLAEIKKNVMTESQDKSTSSASTNNPFTAFPMSVGDNLAQYIIQLQKKQILLLEEKIKELQQNR